MRTLLTILVAALSLYACSSGSAASGPDDPDKIRDNFYAQQEKIMNAHKALLVKSGHMSKDFGGIETYFGTYDWHSGSHMTFGAYSFSQAAFDQAKAGWYGHFEVLEGSNEVWPQDDWGGECQCHLTKFDNTVIGRTLPGMNMSWVDKDGKFQSAYFTAKVVGVKDGYMLVLDQRAPHHAEQWQMAILPDGYVNMCQCTAGAATEHTPQSLAIGQ